VNHWATVRRAWEITWRYRLLWVFGLVLAACTGSGTSSSSSGFRLDAEDWNRLGGRSYVMPDLSRVAAFVVSAALILILVGIFAALISAVLRYLSETALMRTVNDYEDTGVKLAFGQALGLGWSRRALRLFLIDLVVAIPAVVVFALLGALALSPLLLWAIGSDTAGALGSMVTVGLLLLVGLAGILAAVAWSILQPFVWRAAALEDRGVFDSFRRGYAIARARLRDAGLMWLLLVALQLAYGLAVVVVVILLTIVGLLVGALFGVLTYGVASLAFYGSTPIILGVIVGMPILALVVTLPLLLVAALFTVFKSSVWTLTFRELSR